MWDAVTGKALLTLTGHTSTVRQVVFNPDGSHLATSSFDGTAKVWDAVSGKELFTLPAPITGLFGVTFSPDGKTIATAGTDAKLWDALTGKELLTLRAPNGFTSVAFSPDGSQLAAASRDGTNRIYLLRIDDLMALAKQRVTRELTMEECKEYLHVEQCPPMP
jgi:WD40 repeat protein